MHRLKAHYAVVLSHQITKNNNNMKTLKTLAAALLVVLSTSAFANKKKNNETSLAEYALKKYVSAVSYGDVKGISSVLDNDVQLTTDFKNDVQNLNKEQILTSLNFTQNVKQNCETEYKMVERTSTQALAKITQKYDGFTKVNYISLSNTATGWKITHIASSIN